jgi:hypothetical protein
MRKEDPSPSGDLKPSTFYVGRDSHGRWIAQDADHLRGGLFVSRAAAMKFAMDETGHRPEAIVPLNHIIELDFGASALRYAPSSRPLSKAA